MEQQKFLIDTNILIYYLENQIADDKIDFVEEVLRKSFSISIITQIEMLSYALLNSADEEQIHLFLEAAEIFAVDKSLVKKIADIRKKYKLKLPDAIIGATAQMNNRTLLTRNTKDFSKIEGLDIINPID